MWSARTQGNAEVMMWKTCEDEWKLLIVWWLWVGLTTYFDYRRWKRGWKELLRQWLIGKSPTILIKVSCGASQKNFLRLHQVCPRWSKRLSLLCDHLTSTSSCSTCNRVNYRLGSLFERYKVYFWVTLDESIQWNYLLLENGDGQGKKQTTSRPRKRPTEPSERKSKKRKKMDGNVSNYANSKVGLAQLFSNC